MYFYHSNGSPISIGLQTNISTSKKTNVQFLGPCQEVLTDRKSQDGLL